MITATIVSRPRSSELTYHRQVIVERGVRCAKVMMIPTAGGRKKRASKAAHKHD